MSLSPHVCYRFHLSRRQRLVLAVVIILALIASHVVAGYVGRHVERYLTVERRAAMWESLADGGVRKDVRRQLAERDGR